jgi:uncharacterized lipoprotein YehR (DUF1307 family)
MAGSNNKKNKLRGVTEIVNPNHKRKINESTSWVDLGSGNRPTNSTAQTFGLFYTGTDIPVPDANFNNVTAVFGGLGGVESLPASFTYADAEGVEVSVDPPTYNQLAVAGFAKPLGKYDNFIRKSAAKKASQINDQLDASEKVAARANADVLMKARVEEAEKIYNDLYKQYEAEKKAVDEYNKNVDNAYEKEKEKVRVNNEKIMMQHHKTISGVKWDSVRQMGVPDIDNVPAGSDLDIQNKLNAKYFKNGVMTITPEKYAQLFDEMGGKANEETRERLEKKIKPDPERPPYKEYPSYPDYPDVYNDSIWKDGLNSSTNAVDPTALNKIPGASTAVVFDYYLNWLNKTKGGNTQRQDLSNLMSEKDKEWIRDFIEHMKSKTGKIIDADVAFQNRTRIDDDQILGIGASKADDDKGGIPFGIRNIIGDINTGRGEGFSEDDDYYYVNKKYDFENWDDTKAPGVGSLSSAYAWSKGLGKWMDKGEHGSPTMHMVIKIPKNKKKKKEDKKLKEGKTFKNFMSSINN